MPELTRACQKAESGPALERRLLKQVRAIMRKDRGRIQSGAVREDDVREAAEISAAETLLEQTSKDLASL